MNFRFQLVMQYLYCGGCNNLEVSASDVLELMAAASFFQLEGLLRYTEARCAEIIDIDNVVAMYIHAKVNSIISSRFICHVRRSCTGVQCIKAHGVLPRLPPAEHGGLVNIRRLCKAPVVCEKNSESRCPERFANNAPAAHQNPAQPADQRVTECCQVGPNEWQSRPQQFDRRQQYQQQFERFEQKQQ